MSAKLDEGHVSHETLSPEVASLRESKNCPKCGGAMEHKRRRWICKPCKNASQRDWRAAHPQSEEARRKDIVRSIAGVNKRREKLTPQPCEKCGSAEVQMHHEDYSQPLAVRWLCAKCHTSEHHPEAEGKAVRVRRSYIRHGGTLCCRCHRNPPSTNGKYCKLCRNAYDAARRKTKALGEKQKLSEGDTNEQHKTIDIGQMPATAGKPAI